MWWIERKMMLFGIWLARLVPAFFKPLKFYVADRMILACGYQEKTGETIVMYRPAKQSFSHTVYGRQGWSWRQIPDSEENEILDGKMRTVLIKNKAISKTRVKGWSWQGPVRSKKINQRKSTTVFEKSGLVMLGNKTPVFRWRNPEDRNFWFSFLTVEDEHGHLYAGVYTKMGVWQYGDLETLPYYVQRPALQSLPKGKNYKATLYQVNHDNWVTHIDTLTFNH